MTDEVRLTLEEVHELATDALLAHGVAREHVRAIADNVTTAERDDAKSHGLFRIPFYVRTINKNKVTLDAVPTVKELSPSVVQVDAGNGFAPLALEIGAGPLIEKARQNGVAALATVRCYHIAALWPEAERIAAAGLVAFAFTGSIRFVAPAGGIKPLYGTNPMAFAWPRQGRPPVIFDQSSSASARGEIMLHQRDGEPIPQGWAIDVDGRPTTDPDAGLAGAQLPFGGYKGAGIALMVELLTGALIGDVFSFEADAIDRDDSVGCIGGHFMLAIDPLGCVDHGDRAGQLAHAEKLFEEILSQDGTRLPADRRYAARERTATEGVVIPRSLHETLVGYRDESKR